MGVPTVEQLAASFGISAEEILRNPGQGEELTEEQINALLPTIDQMKESFGLTGDNKKPLRGTEEQSSDIPSVEEIARQLGIKI